MEVGGDTFSFFNPIQTWLGGNVSRAKNEQGNDVATLEDLMGLFKPPQVSSMGETTFDEL